jgi:hypothetical protein
MRSTSVCSFVASLIVVGLGSRRPPNRVPLVGTCSAAISAACHPSRPDGYHEKRSMRWGVDGPMKEKRLEHGDSISIGHCSFTSDPVTYPEVAKLYA